MALLLVEATADIDGWVDEEGEGSCVVGSSLLPLPLMSRSVLYKFQFVSVSVPMSMSILSEVAPSSFQCTPCNWCSTSTGCTSTLRPSGEGEGEGVSVVP
jgi:hypothetical protein